MNLNATRAARMSSIDSYYQRGRPKMRPAAFAVSYHFVECHCWHLSRLCHLNYQLSIAVGHVLAMAAANIHAAIMQTRPFDLLFGMLSNLEWNSAGWGGKKKKPISMRIFQRILENTEVVYWQIHQKKTCLRVVYLCFIWHSWFIGKLNFGCFQYCVLF